MISIFNTYINLHADKYVGELLKSTYISEGTKVQELEEKLFDITGCRWIVAVNSGTSALHLALAVAGIKQGDEVICPAQTFIATAMAILYQGAKPVFADINYETGNIDPKAIEAKLSKKTRGIIVVHWGGYPCNMVQIHALAKQHNLLIIEDAAHALGATYHGKPIGSLQSDFTCFSFQAIKHLTTGDGGAVCCRKEKDARLARQLRWFGIDRVKNKSSYLGERQYNLLRIGYKYHMNDYAAALGLANLQGLSRRLKKRRRFAIYYTQELTSIAGLRPFGYLKDRKSANWLFGVHVEKRKDFIRAMSSRGVQVSVVHQGIDRNSIFGGLQSELVNQRRFDETQIHIPIHEGLSDADADYIVASIKKGW